MKRSILLGILILCVRHYGLSQRSDPAVRVHYFPNPELHDYRAGTMMLSTLNSAIIGQNLAGRRTRGSRRKNLAIIGLVSGAAQVVMPIFSDRSGISAAAGINGGIGLITVVTSVIRLIK